MATTSTGLNYLLGQDNDTARVVGNVVITKSGKKVKGPRSKRFWKKSFRINVK